MSEKNVDITDKIQKIGKTIEEYKNSLMAHFKDMEVEVKDWNFAVGKNESEYTVEVNLKLGIRSKKN